MKVQFRFSFQVNKVVRYLISCDVALATGWGFISPIFAIYLTDQIEGGDAAVAGLATGLYWIVKSIVQPFIAKHLDKNHGEIDDFYYLVGGLFVAGFIPLGYLFISLPIQLYALEMIHAVAMACVIPTWAGIFTRHIDKNQEAFDWSLDSTMLGFGAGVAGILGGVIAQFMGFQFVFLLVSMFTMLSVLVLFPIRPLIMPKLRAPVRPEIRKPPFSEESGSF